jgi:hypothetical protein
MNTNAEPPGSGATLTPALEPYRRVLRPVWVVHSQGPSQPYLLSDSPELR